MVRPAVDVAQRLRDARGLAEVGARELDRLAGLTEGHTSLIESGHVANAKGATLVKLSTTLGVSLDWLIAGKGDAPTRESVRAAVERASTVTMAAG